MEEGAVPHSREISMAIRHEHEPPPRPLGAEVQVSQVGDELSLVYRPSKGQLFGVVACIMFFGYLLISYGLFVLQDGPEEWHPIQVGTVLVWSAFGLALAFLSLFGLVGTERVNLNQIGLRYERRVVLRLRALHVPLSEIKEIRAAVRK